MSIKAIIGSVFFFGIAGPCIGTLLFFIVTAIYNHDLSMILMVFFPPLYFFSYIFGGIPALITGFFYEVIYKKTNNKYVVYVLCSLVGGLIQAIYVVSYLLFEYNRLSVNDGLILLILTALAMFAALSCAFIATKVRS